MKRAVLGVASLTSAAAAAYVLRARDWQLRWGATDDEVRAPLPGDALLPDADLVATRSVTINADAREVWPWVVQLGQGRGGFYSYDLLENLVAGCNIRSADHIVGGWQQIAVGDQVNLHPEVSLTVVEVEQGRSLVLSGGVPVGRAAPPYDFTWAFVLRPEPDNTTRLVVRERYAYTRRWAPLLVEPVEVVSFVMSRKMLHGIRDRAEARNADNSDRASDRVGHLASSSKASR